MRERIPIYTILLLTLSADKKHSRGPTAIISYIILHILSAVVTYISIYCWEYVFEFECYTTDSSRAESSSRAAEQQTQQQKKGNTETHNTNNKRHQRNTEIIHKVKKLQTQQSERVNTRNAINSTYLLLV